MPKIQACQIILQGINEGKLDVEFILFVIAIVVVLNHVQDLLLQPCQILFLQKLFAQPATLTVINLLAVVVVLEELLLLLF